MTTIESTKLLIHILTRMGREGDVEFLQAIQLLEQNKKISEQQQLMQTSQREDTYCSKQRNQSKFLEGGTRLMEKGTDHLLQG